MMNVKSEVSSTYSRYHTDILMRLRSANCHTCIQGQRPLHADNVNSFPPLLVCLPLISLSVSLSLVILDFFSACICVCVVCNYCSLCYLCQFQHWDRVTMLSESQRHVKTSVCAFICRACLSLLSWQHQTVSVLSGNLGSKQIICLKCIKKKKNTTLSKWLHEIMLTSNSC